MSFADDVRAYAFEHYVKLARQRGEHTVTIRARDVHDGLHYSSRFPLVCTALASLKFQNEYGLTLVKIDGPVQSSTTAFTLSW